MYEAIMKAAQQIEDHPKTFNFDATSVPRSCGSPGCALGWIAYFGGRDKYAGERFKGSFFGFRAGLWFLGMDEHSTGYVFYSRLTALTDEGWKKSANKCAKALRLYAKKYHAPAKIKENKVTWKETERITGWHPDLCTV